MCFNLHMRRKGRLNCFGCTKGHCVGAGSTTSPNNLLLLLVIVLIGILKICFGGKKNILEVCCHVDWLDWQVWTGLIDKLDGKAG